MPSKSDWQREGEISTFAPSPAPTGPPALRLIHYNDVYHVEPGSREPVGGFARFKSLCDFYGNDAKFEGQPKVLTVFSGDAFNPSLESSVTKGKHMVPALNGLGTNIACLGNHDLDFGVEQFEHLAKQCKFPWLCANVLDPALGQDVPLGDCKRTVMLTASNGLKVGFIGLVEREWLDTINTLPPNLKYLSASATAAGLAPKLRAEGAEMVIAISHQREPNDNKLAEKVPPGTLDLILGGHDHFYNHSIINSCHVLRSGSDFKQLSYLEAHRTPTNAWTFTITRRDVQSTIPPDPTAVTMVDKITAALKPKLEKPIGYTAAPLDARFTTVRTRESNMGNFICDLMRCHYGTDCCIMAAGTIRGDQIYPPGVLRVRDVMNCFPFEDPCVVVRLAGEHIVAALENAVGKYPALEGRFPQVSGVTFVFDPARPEGSRCSDVKIGGEPMQVERLYTLATRDYMVRGKDGFTMLMLDEDGGPAESVVSEESGLLISMLLRQYFMSLKVLGRWRSWGEHMGRHWDEVHRGLHAAQPVREAASPGLESPVDGKGAADGVPSLVGRAQRRPPTAAESVQAVNDLDPVSDSETEDEESTTGAPAVAMGELRERELAVARRVMRKWRRVAGLKGQPRAAEGVGENDGVGVGWAKGICPRVEGRIRMIGGDA